MNRSNLILSTFLFATAAISCAAAPAPHSNLSYAEEAQTAYQHALEQLQNNDLLDATTSFQHVRRDYGVSRWGRLAELRLAEIDFRSDKFAEARQAYRNWIRYNPSQPEVAEARFMIAKSYYAEIPSDWALVPDSWQRDQSSTHDAEDALQRFLSDFGTTRFATEARELLRTTRRLLAQNEMAVGDFYLSRDRPDAAIARYREVLASYGGSGLEPDALNRIGQVYLSTGRRAEAHEAFETVVTRFPQSSYVEGARRYIVFIGPVATVPSSSSPPPGT